MAAINLDGEPIKEEVVEEKQKSASISPFDFVDAISYSKKNLIVDDWSERQYNPYVINKSLSFGSDTVIQANEMNSRPHIEKHLQFSFLINTVRARKRYNKWIKADKVENLELVKKYFNYNTEKAVQALKLLSPEQLQIIQNKMFTGGLNNGT